MVKVRSGQRCIFSILVHNSVINPKPNPIRNPGAVPLRTVELSLKQFVAERLFQSAKKLLGLLSCSKDDLQTV